MPQYGLPDHVLAEARRILGNGHSLTNTARLLSRKFDRNISAYVLRYWVDDGFRDRKRQRVRERNAREKSDTRRSRKGASKAPPR